MNSFPRQNGSPRTVPIEAEVKWYPEEERERLENKYASCNGGVFSNLVFEEKFEPYAVDPQFKKLKVPEKCGKCRSCNAAITGSPYCRMEAASLVNSQMDISTIYVDVNSRPTWCPMIKMSNELDRMPFEQRAKFEKFRTVLSSLFGEEDLWEMPDAKTEEEEHV